MTKRVVERLCGALLFVPVLTSCMSSGDANSNEIVTVVPGQMFTIEVDNTKPVGRDFVLQRDDGKVIFILSPAFGTESPKFVPVEGDSFARLPAALVMDNGELRFVAPPSLPAGAYELCDMEDVCHTLKVEQPR